jgi:FlaG/FlaF family flagellin (archaellin)
MTHEATASLATSSSRRRRLARSVPSLIATVALAATSLLLASAPAQAVVPAAPTINSITAGNAQLSVAFTAPDPGDSAITTYQYSTNAGVTWKTREDGGTTASPWSSPT